MKQSVSIILGSILLSTLLSSCVATVRPAGVVVRPKAVVTLPVGYKTVWVGGHKYHVHRNVYYKHSHGRYVVVKKPVGTVRYVAPKATVRRVKKHHIRYHR